MNYSLNKDIQTFEEAPLRSIDNQTAQESIGFYHLRTFNKKFKRETAMCSIEYRAYHIKFKEVMGMTPDEYQKLNDPSSEEL